MGAMQTVLVPILESFLRNSKGKLHHRLRIHSDGIGRVVFCKRLPRNRTITLRVLGQFEYVSHSELPNLEEL